MRYIKWGGDVVDVELPRRSVYMMRDEARYKWNHRINQALEREGSIVKFPLRLHPPFYKEQYCILILSSVPL